jgi:hypothetical protein
MNVHAYIMQPFFLMRQVPENARSYANFSIVIHKCGQLDHPSFALWHLYSLSTACNMESVLCTILNRKEVKKDVPTGTEHIWRKYNRNH